MMLRIFIDKEGGVTLDGRRSQGIVGTTGCGRYYSGKFFLQFPLRLNRPLKSRADYDRYVGKLVKIKTFAAAADDAATRKTFLGKLLADGDLILLKLQEGRLPLFLFQP
ncbi:MAG: hypothetical protein MZV70_73540 [Desulfobacterales bacterium]|nr:hypothetical protein [Desulfobacterales bacterium]